jgi:hypothetical protein
MPEPAERLGRDGITGGNGIVAEAAGSVYQLFMMCRCEIEAAAILIGEVCE